MKFAITAAAGLAFAAGANADVSLTAGGTLNLSNVSIDTGIGSLTLASLGGVLATQGTLSGGNVWLTGSDGIVLGNDVTALGNLALSSANAAIVQTGGALLVGGNGTIDAGGGDVTLTSADNDFAGTVNLTGGAVAITDANALTLGMLDVGSLAATSQGALSLGQGAIAGTLDADSNGGTITPGAALSVGGTSTIDAGSGGCLDIVIASGAPQISLVLKQAVVQLPESVDILARHALCRQRGEDAGIAMIQHGPEDQPHLPRLHIGLHHLRLCA